MCIFQQILGTASLTAIEFIAERALPSVTPDEQQVLRRILKANVLDEVYALCHDHLGQPEEAAHLREFVKTRAQRRMTLRPAELAV